MYTQHERDLLKPHLFADERLFWAGQPKQGLVCSGRDVFLIPFSLLWGGFALFWNLQVWSFPATGPGQPDWFFRLWGLPFLIVGIYLIIGRFIHDAALRKNTVYGVTDQRVLVIRGLTSGKLSSLDIGRLPKLDLTEHKDGTGTIDFEGNEQTIWGNGGFGYWTPAMSSTKRFFQIGNPRDVYQLVRKQAHASGDATSSEYHHRS